MRLECISGVSVDTRHAYVSDVRRVLEIIVQVQTPRVACRYGWRKSAYIHT